VNQDGSWACTAATALPAGAHTVTVTQVGADGAQLDSSVPMVFTVGALTPVQRVLNALAKVSLVAVLVAFFHWCASLTPTA
jgi:hypothetical protein